MSIFFNEIERASLEGECLIINGRCVAEAVWFLRVCHLKENITIKSLKCTGNSSGNVEIFPMGRGNRRVQINSDEQLWDERLVNTSSTLFGPIRLILMESLLLSISNTYEECVKSPLEAFLRVILALRSMSISELQVSMASGIMQGPRVAEAAVSSCIILSRGLRPQVKALAVVLMLSAGVQPVSAIGVGEGVERSGYWVTGWLGVLWVLIAALNDFMTCLGYRALFFRKKSRFPEHLEYVATGACNRRNSEHDGLL